MDIHFIGKKISMTKEVQEHVREKLSKLERYAPRLIESHVVVKHEKNFFKGEITLFAKNLRVYGEAESKDNVYAALDGAYVRVEKQLKKFREKVKSHHHKGLKSAFAEKGEAESSQ